MTARVLTVCAFLAAAGVAVAQNAQVPRENSAREITTSAAPAASTRAAAEAAQLEGMLKKVEAALPDVAPVAPAKPRKLLVVSTTYGYRHASIPLGVKAITMMGEKTKAYAVTATEDPACFEADTLAKYDAVLFLSTTGEIFTGAKKGEAAPAPEVADRRKKAFLAFVASGKGVVGVHAATDCNYKWADYGEVMGGYFNGHPWHEKVQIKNVEPEHPVNAAFEKKGFEVADEIYQMKDPYSRAKQRELLGLASSEKDPELKKGKREDHDYPVSWVKTYGEGRVFYCSLGHREEIFWNPAILKHYLAGLQFALGDLKADASPTQKASTDEVLGRFAGAHDKP